MQLSSELETAFFIWVELGRIELPSGQSTPGLSTCLDAHLFFRAIGRLSIKPELLPYLFGFHEQPEHSVHYLDRMIRGTTLSSRTLIKPEGKTCTSRKGISIPRIKLPWHTDSCQIKGSATVLRDVSYITACLPRDYTFPSIPVSPNV